MDFLKVAVVIAFILLTLGAIKFHPEMHQPMILEDADFVLTRISDTIADTSTPITVSATQTETVVTPVEVSEPRQVEQSKVFQPVRTVETSTPKTTTKVVQTQTSPKEVKVQENKTSQIELLQRVLKNSENADVVKQTPIATNTTKTTKTTQPKTTQTSKTTQPKTTQTVTTQPKTVQQPPQKTVEQKPVQQPKSSSNPYMTEQEEIIAWNIWRSNIQNTIMKNSTDAARAPLGTTYSFTFIVDKFGNVSNIKVECNNPDYMHLARNSVKPAISALQKKPILNFPKGTKRTSTVFTGYFMIGVTESYSTPANYSDYEKVVR